MNESKKQSLNLNPQLQIIRLSLMYHYNTNNGPGSSVSIATGYGLDGPGIESLWRRDFSHLSRPALGPNQPPVQGVPCLSRGTERPERDSDPSLPSSAVVMKG
jgi:hypothetical protein